MDMSGISLWQRSQRTAQCAAALATALLVVAFAACDDDESLLVFAELERDALVGFWTGEAEITTEGDISRTEPGPIDEGVTFPVALQLTDKGRFVLHTFNYPVASATTRRTCSGVYEREGRRLEFFPNVVCRALPLNDYTIGRAVPDVLILEARAGLRPDGSEPLGNMFVSMRLERD